MSQSYQFDKNDPKILLIANVILDHETTYEQFQASKDAQYWKWSCKCGKNANVFNRDMCVRQSQIHWAEEIVKTLGALE